MKAGDIVWKRDGEFLHFGVVAEDGRPGCLGFLASVRDGKAEVFSMSLIGLQPTKGMAVIETEPA